MRMKITTNINVWSLNLKDEDNDWIQDELDDSEEILIDYNDLEENPKQLEEKYYIFISLLRKRLVNCDTWNVCLVLKNSE